MLDNFGDAADVGGDNGDFAGHGFEGGKAEGFELRGKQEKVGGGELFVDGILFAKEEDIFLEAMFADEVFGGATVGTVADEDEPGGHFSADEGEDFHDVGEALDGRKLERCMRMGSPLGAHCAAETFVGGAIVKITVHEIGK